MTVRVCRLVQLLSSLVTVLFLTAPSRETVTEIRDVSLLRP